MKLTVEYVINLGEEKVFEDYCENINYDVDRSAGIIIFESKNKHFAVKINNLVSFKYEETEGNNTTKENSKTPIKAMKITMDILSKPCQREFGEMISNIVTLGMGGTLCFHTETGTIEGKIGDYIVYEDGKFRIYSDEYFNKYYTKEI
jgi:hypothetical protein|nr:MAG TPA: hypothetical protein [Caudoviricetes sp.]